MYPTKNDIFESNRVKLVELINARLLTPSTYRLSANRRTGM